MVTGIVGTKDGVGDLEGEQQQSVKTTTKGTAAAAEDSIDNEQTCKRQRQGEDATEATVAAGTGAATGDDSNKKKLPKKVYQDDFRPGHGNALQAAVASIFGLELEQVPNFVELFMGYEAGIEQFCNERGMTSTKIRLSGDDVTTPIDDAREGRLCVLRGRSPRGDFGHVVVARRTSQPGAKSATGGFEMIHDPHPDESFLDRSESLGWCMFFDESPNEDSTSNK